MTYSDFNLKTVTKNFNLTICERINMFANVSDLEPSPLLLEFLKDEDIMGGLGQCVAEMLAARIFNERENNQIATIYRAVTSGNTWRFLELKDQVIEIDLTEYYLIDINKILGILASVINH